MKLLKQLFVPYLVHRSPYFKQTYHSSLTCHYQTYRDNDISISRLHKNGTDTEPDFIFAESKKREKKGKKVQEEKEKEKEKGKKNLSSSLYYAQTYNQQHYLNALYHPNSTITLGVGPAGCGKTLFACKVAIEKLIQGSIQKIILTRPVVAVEEDIGFLPGTLSSKMEPWTQPMFDVFEEYLPTREVETLVRNGKIVVSPLAYMRGYTFKNAFVIADEMQNSSPNQMLMLLTRVGINTQLVVTGDLKQSDRMEDNGLKDFLKKYHSVPSSMVEHSGIHCIQFNQTDIRRSAVVNKVIDIYQYIPSPTSGPISIVSYEKPSIQNNKTVKNEGVDDAALIPKHHSSRHFNI
jgi:phosphate starvation-inducible PhoH-like protein